MTSFTVWRCQAPDCKTPLATVRDGVLEPIVSGVTFDRVGVARLTCPLCKLVRLWRPPKWEPRAPPESVLS